MPKLLAGWNADRALNVATALTLAATLVVLGRIAVFSSPPESDGPPPLERGDSVRSFEVATDSALTLRIDFSDGPKVIYAFLTTCRVCEAQRDSIHDLLAQLPVEIVLTGSVEALDRTRDYWRKAEQHDSKLRRPVQFSEMALLQLRAYAVPYLVVVGRTGTVVYSHVGTTNISVEQLKDLLR